MNVFFLCLCIFLTGVSSFAEDKRDQAPTSSSSDDDDDVASEQNRSDKRFTATFQFFGTGPNRTLDKAVAVGYFLQPNLVLILEGSRGKEYELDLFDDTEAAGKSIGIHIKHFVGNSFYYRGGFDYREIEYSYADDFFTTESRTFDAKSWGATFNIGNQWQWDNFTLGCDWVGVTVPFSKSYSNETLATSGSLASAQDEMDHDKDQFVEKANLNLLRFYIGASF